MLDSYLEPTAYFYLCIMFKNDTIVALATPAGSGAIAVIRLSGSEAHKIAAGIFIPAFAKAELQPSTPYFMRLEYTT